MCTEFQKKIYNEHLKSSRIAKGQPFRLRKNFEKLHESDKLNLIRLESFFASNEYINISDFFNSPYSIYSKDEYFDLKFFTTQKAIAVYSLYMKHIMEADPDSIIDRIVFGVKFINKFCSDNNITLDQFADHETGLYPTFILHLKKFIYPLYVIFYIQNGEKNFNKIPLDERIFLFSDNVYGNIPELNRKVKKSVNAHRVLTAWVNKHKNTQK